MSRVCEVSDLESSSATSLEVSDGRVLAEQSSAAMKAIGPRDTPFSVPGTSEASREGPAVQARAAQTQSIPESRQAIEFVHDSPSDLTDLERWMHLFSVKPIER